MWEAARFLFFSNVESFAAFTLMLTIFRLKPMRYLWQALFVFLIMNLQSYFLREELSLAYIVPATSTILYILLITIIVRVPILWSAIISVTGMFLYTMFQGIFILLFYGGVTADMQYSADGAALQAIASVWTFLFSWLLQKFKIGFTAEFERLRFKWEHIMVLIFILASLTVSSLVMYYNNLLFIILFLAVASAFFIYYLIVKERAEYANDDDV